MSGLLTAFSSDLGINCLPCGNAVREPSGKQATTDKIEKIALFGSSQMRHLADHLWEIGYGVMQVNLLGGLPSDRAIADAAAHLHLPELEDRGGF